MGLMCLTLVKTRVQEDEAALAVFDPEENIGQRLKESQCDLTGAQCSHKVLKSESGPSNSILETLGK